MVVRKALLSLAALIPWAISLFVALAGFTCVYTDCHETLFKLGSLPFALTETQWIDLIAKAIIISALIAAIGLNALLLRRFQGDKRILVQVVSWVGGCGAVWIAVTLSCLLIASRTVWPDCDLTCFRK